MAAIVSVGHASSTPAIPSATTFLSTSADYSDRYSHQRHWTVHARAVHQQRRVGSIIQQLRRQMATNNDTDDRTCLSGSADRAAQSRDCFGDRVAFCTNKMQTPQRQQALLSTPSFRSVVKPFPPVDFDGLLSCFFDIFLAFLKNFQKSPDKSIFFRLYL